MLARVHEELVYELRAQRDVLLRHFEAIDAKAGIVLGFSGLIAGTIRRADGLLVAKGRVLTAAFVLVIMATGSFGAAIITAGGAP